MSRHHETACASRTVKTRKSLEEQFTETSKRERQITHGNRKQCRLDRCHLSVVAVDENDERIYDVLLHKDLRFLTAKS